MATKQATQLETTAQEAKIQDWLREHDFQLWFNRKPIKIVREQVEKELRLKTSVRQFRELRERACKWWKKEPRRKPTVNMLLDAAGWEQLRAAVRKRLPDIQGGRSMRQLQSCGFIRTATGRCWKA